MTAAPKPKASSNSPVESQDPSLSGLPTWKCELVTYQKDLPSLNVGDLFVLKCQGDDLVELSKESVHVQFLNREDDYKLKILSTQISDPLSKEFLVTSYKPGEHKLSHITIQDETQKGFQVESLEFTVASVIDPQNPPQGEYGPLGPYSLQWPWWHWASWGIGIFLVLFLVAKYLRRYLQRRRLLEELSVHNTALPAFQVFNKEIRILMREASLPDKVRKAPFSIPDYFKSIEKSFKMYLVRRFKVPAHIWSSNAVLRDLRKRHKKVYQDEGVLIKKIFVEIEKAESSLSTLTKEDCEQLIEMSRIVLQRIERRHKEATV